MLHWVCRTSIVQLFSLVMSRTSATAGVLVQRLASTALISENLQQYHLNSRFPLPSSYKNYKYNYKLNYFL